MKDKTYREGGNIIIVTDNNRFVQGTVTDKTNKKLDIHQEGNAEYKTLEDNEENRKADYEYCKKTYGKDCDVFQKDSSGKVIRENGRNVEEIENNLTAQGF